MPHVLTGVVQEFEHPQECVEAQHADTPPDRIHFCRRRALMMLRPVDGDLDRRQVNDLRDGFREVDRGLEIDLASRPKWLSALSIGHHQGCDHRFEFEDPRLKFHVARAQRVELGF
jgi:hypothetical protein